MQQSRMCVVPFGHSAAYALELFLDLGIGAGRAGRGVAAAAARSKRCLVLCVLYSAWGQ